MNSVTAYVSPVLCVAPTLFGYGNRVSKLCFESHSDRIDTRAWHRQPLRVCGQSSSLSSSS